MKSKALNILTIMALSLLSSCALDAQKVAPQNPSLAKEIVKMRDIDQKLRNKWVKMIKKGQNSGKKYEETKDLLISTDEKNTSRMREIIEQYGWPTRSLVGSGASNSAWLIVQHADRDPMFQQKCLPLLKASVDNNEANPSNYAYLYDRVAAASGKKQLYATQSSSNNGLVEGTFYPIEDESKVQERRIEMGFDQHVEAYASSMGFEYTIPSAEDAIKRSNALIENYNADLSKAKSAEEQGDYETAIKYYKKATSAYGVCKADDFYNYARLVCSSNHKDTRFAAYSLMKSALQGYSNPTSWDTDPIFENCKKESPHNWKMLMNTINQLKNQ